MRAAWSEDAKSTYALVKVSVLSLDQVQYTGKGKVGNVFLLNIKLPTSKFPIRKAFVDRDITFYTSLNLHGEYGELEKWLARKQVIQP